MARRLLQHGRPAAPCCPPPPDALRCLRGPECSRGRPRPPSTAAWTSCRNPPLQMQVQDPALPAIPRNALVDRAEADHQDAPQAQPARDLLRTPLPLQFLLYDLQLPVGHFQRRGRSLMPSLFRVGLRLLLLAGADAAVPLHLAADRRHRAVQLAGDGSERMAGLHQRPDLAALVVSQMVVALRQMFLHTSTYCILGLPGRNMAAVTLHSAMEGVLTLPLPWRKLSSRPRPSPGRRCSRRRRNGVRRPGYTPLKCWGISDSQPSGTTGGLVFP